MAKWALFVLLTATPAQVSAYLGGALRTHTHRDNNSGGIVSRTQMNGISIDSFTVTSSFTVIPGITFSQVSVASLTVTSSFTAITGSVSSWTVTNALTASSASLTATGSNVYALTLSTGLYLQGTGTINLSASPSNSIKYFDGSVSTTGALSITPPYTVNFGTANLNVTDTAFTNTSFTGCLAGGSTVQLRNVVSTSRGIRCDVNITSYNGTLAAFNYFTVYMDGATFPVTQVAGAQDFGTQQGIVVNSILNTTFWVYFPSPGAGTHNFCMAGKVNAGTGNTNCDITGSASTEGNCVIWCEEKP